jgi:hypothetical protein
MKILVYGTDKFEDYPTFMRGMVVAIEENMNNSDGRLDVYTAGPHKINNFVAEFVNRSEAMFKQNGIKARFNLVRKAQVTEDFDTYEFDHVLSFNSKEDQRFLMYFWTKQKIVRSNRLTTNTKGYKC